MTSSFNRIIIIITVYIIIIIIAAVVRDNGVCEALNFVGEAKELKATEGDDVELECKLDEAAHEPHLYWMRGPTVYATAHESFHPLKEVTRKGTSFYMIIRQVKVEDGGEYMCQVPVPGGDAITYVQNLVVNVPPSIKPFDHLIVEVDENSPLNVDCQTTGKPDPIVSWSKLKKNSAKEEMVSDSAILFISSVTSSSSGVYECRADNLVGSAAVQSLKVIVHHKPKCWSPSNQVTTGPGYTTMVECSCSSHSDVLVTWYHNDEPIKYDRRTNLLRRDDTSSNEELHKSILKLKETKADDLGKYTCVGSNRMGVANHSIVLTAKPSNLKILSLRTKNIFTDRYALEWTVTSYAKITSFVVSIHRIEGRRSHFLTNMTIQPRNQQLPPKTNNFHSLMANHYQSDFIIGLPSATNFTIQMMALNSFGASPWTDVGYFQTISEGCSNHGSAMSIISTTIIVYLYYLNTIF